MKHYIDNIPIRKAALIVGVAFISSIIIVTIIDDFLLPNFVIPGDTAALANDIAANRTNLTYAIAGYLVVLILDAVIGIALYIVLKPANKQLAMYTGALRLLYAFIVILGLFVLLFQIIDVYGYALVKLIGYVFFALHLLFLGFSVIKSGYIPKSMGMLLMLASFTYIVFFVDTNLPEPIQMTIMLIMAISELSLSIWLIARSNRLPQ